MAWIESHQSLARHPKTRRFARLLGISVPAAIGHLHLLWYWALDYVQDGDLTPFEAADVADCAMWDGDAKLFVEALTECGTGAGCGFLELTGGRLLIHDWQDYAGKLVDKRQSDAERKRLAYKEKRRTTAPTTPVRSESGKGKPTAGDEPTDDSPTRAEGQSGTDEEAPKHLGRDGKDTPRPSVQPPDILQRISSGYPAEVAGTVPNPTVPNPTNTGAADAAVSVPGKRPRKPPSTGAVAEFIEAYRTRYHEDPHIGTGQAVQLANLRKELGEAAFRAVVACYVADDEKSLCDAAHPVAFMASRLVAIKGKLNGSAPRLPGAVPSNGYVPATPDEAAALEAAKAQYAPKGAP